MAVNSTRLFVESYFGGDARTAIREIAEMFDLGVSVMDRADMDEHLGRELSDDEWEDLAPEMDGYDDFLKNSGAAESISTWKSQALDRAGIDVE